MLGETDGRWTKLRGDRDVYATEVLIQEKKQAKLVRMWRVCERLGRLPLNDDVA